MFRRNGPLPQSVSATEILYENFESWNENSWSNSTSSGASISITSDVVYAGSYALNSTSADPVGSYSYIYKDVSASTTVYAGAYYNTTALPNSGYYFDWLRFQGGSGLKRWIDISVYTNATDSYWKFSYWYGADLGSTAILYNATPNLAADTWYQIKGKVFANASNGEAKCWINGDLTFNVTGLDNDYETGVSRFSVGNRYDWQGISYSLYTDSFKSDTADITWSTIPTVTQLWYNSTRAGNGTQFRSDWICDNSELQKAWFETNNTGSNVNSSLITLSGISDSAYFNMTLNSTGGVNIQWRWHANSSTSDVGSSGWANFDTTSIEYDSGLVTDGLFIKDTDGNVVTLRGYCARDFATTGYSHGFWYAEGSVTPEATFNETVVKQYFDAMKITGANAYYPLFNLEWWISNESGYCKNFRLMAQWLNERDMYFKPTMWNVKQGNAHPKTAYPPWSESGDETIVASEQAWIDLWVNIAGNFTQYPNTIIEFQAEPHGNSTVRESYLGTASTLGVAERVMLAVREISDNLISIHWGYAILPTAGFRVQDFAPLVNFNQSYNVFYSPHIYRDGYETQRWNNGLSNLHANLTTAGVIGADRPMVIGEIGLNLAVENLAEEKTWMKNSFTIFNNYSIGYFLYAWHEIAMYRVFNYTQATSMAKWGWIPEMENPSGFYFIQQAHSTPFVWTVGNETLSGYQYLYSNNTAWSSTWNENLTVTYSGNCEARIFWNISSSYPINSTLQCVHSNGTWFNASDYYDFDTNLIKLWGASGSSWLIGYNVSGTGDNPPTSSNINSNATTIGTTCLFSTYWNDDNGLSHYIFEQNNTGTLTNTTVAFGGTPAWSNQTLTLNSTVGVIVRWRYHANDTINQWNQTAWQSIITTSIVPPSVEGTFVVLIENGGSLGFQSRTESPIQLTVTSGAINSSEVSISIDYNSGSFRFVSNESVTFTVIFENVTNVNFNGERLLSGDSVSVSQNMTGFLYWVFFVEPFLPIKFIFGSIGLVCMFVAPLYCIHLFKKKEYQWALVQLITVGSIGVGLVLAWLWGGA